MTSPALLPPLAANAPLRVRVACQRCGAHWRAEVPRVFVHPSPEGWDGIVLGRVVECPGCGAVDEYAVDDESKAMLLSRCAAPVAGDAAEDERVSHAILRMWDGTEVRRPSHALEKVRREAEQSPGGAAWRRVGNLCATFGLREEAARAWRSAVEADADEAEAACSLAAMLFEDADGLEGFRLLCMAVERLPKAHDMHPSVREEMGRSIARMLFGVLRATNEPLALEAAWGGAPVGEQGIVHLSGVDLRRVRDWDALAEFLGRDDLLAMRLKPDLPPDDEETQLEHLLNGGAVPDFTPPQPVVRAGPKVGRNEPCPCGSGRKYKRCCGR